MTKAYNKTILTLNGGSSSIKFGIYKNEETPVQILTGKIERIGLHNVVLTYNDINIGRENSQPVNAVNIQEAVGILLEWFEKKIEFENLLAIGHRFVHGKEHTDAQIITDTLLDELQKIIPYDPDHLPGEIELVNAFRDKFPNLPQVVCFDTNFHTTLPGVARMLPIPRRFDDLGIRKYGFHGLSYSYLMSELINLGEKAAINGRVILAHLGSGASLAAVLDGRSIDTSMGFTPAGGFMMGTRPGDLDPGLAAIIMKKESLTAEQFSDLINHQCGLLGISETSSDMHDLLESENSDSRAMEAVNLFCYQVKKWIGSFAVVLEGLDVLVFSGGIGENAPAIRSRICEGLKFMGIDLDEKLNEKNKTIISSARSKVTVYVIQTNEEIMIAKTVCRVLNL